LTSFWRIAGRRWMMRRMFRRATYWTSGPEERRVTAEGTHRGKIFSQLDWLAIEPTEEKGARGLTERRTHLALEACDDALVGHVVHKVEDDLDRCEDDGRVGVLESDRDPFGECLGVEGVHGREGEKGVENVDLAPSGQRSGEEATVSAPSDPN
jgi:hypothetical protein